MKGRQNDGDLCVELADYMTITWSPVVELHFVNYVSKNKVK